MDKSKVLNLFEHPIAADLDGLPGVEVLKGGLTLAGLVNLGVAVGQNLPYNHVLQGWEGRTGTSLPAFPQAVEDYQLLSSPAVADVGGGPGREAVVGTGLYLLRALDAAGVEPAGFPKFTGGWLYAVPATGDVDGDGRLDLVAVTREGRAFVWNTGRPACSGNGEWWTSRHDERSTGAHGTDTRPPGTATARRAAVEGGALRLSWDAPGDDWACGTPARLEIAREDGSVVARGTTGTTARLPGALRTRTPHDRLRRRGGQLGPRRAVPAGALTTSPGRPAARGAYFSSSFSASSFAFSASSLAFSACFLASSAACSASRSASRAPSRTSSSPHAGRPPRAAAESSRASARRRSIMPGRYPPGRA